MQRLKTKQQEKINIKRKTVLLSVSAFCAGFICSGTRIMGNPCSLGVCAAAVGGRYSPFAVLGMLFYLLLPGAPSEGFTSLCAAVLVGAAFPVIRHFKFYAPAALSIASCLIMLMVNSVRAFGLGLDSYAIAFAMTDAVICSCVIFMFTTLADEYSVAGRLCINGVSGVFAALLFIMGVCTLSSIPLPLNLGRTAGTVVLLFFAKKYRAVGGALIGVLTACGVILSTPSLASNTLIMASSGLICGALSGLGPLVSITSFMVSSLLSLTAVGVNSDTFVMFWDLAFGAMISIIIPDEVIGVGRSFLSTAKSTVDLVGQTASSRLGFAAKTLGDIRREIAVVSLKIEDRNRPDSIKDRVVSDLCKGCECCELCLKKNGSNTFKAFEILEEIAKSYGTVTLTDVRNYVPSCSKSASLQLAFERMADELSFESAGSRTVSNMRELLCEQLLSMEELLHDMSSRVNKIKEIDEHLSIKAKELFDINGCRGARVCVYTNETRRRFAEVFINGSFKGDIVRLTLKLSDICECDMELPSINIIGKVTRLVFTEKPDLEASIGTFQASCRGGEYCGDTIDSLTINESERYVLLSDGMGTGERARLDSMFTVSLVSRLISSGISMTCSQRLINSALCVKSWDESFSTIDILKLDLFSHTASFLKAGAAASFIYREGSIIKIESNALPAGILTACEPSVKTQRINAGDVIIIASDGLDEQLVMQNAEFLEKSLACSPDKASEMLGDLAVKSCGSNVSDDITIAVVRIDRCT